MPAYSTGTGAPSTSVWHLIAIAFVSNVLFRTLSAEPMKHFEFTLDLFWDPSQGGSNYFSIYLQIFFFVLVVICSMIRSNKLLPGRLQLILRYGLFVSAIYHVCPLQQFWSGSDLGPTFFAFALYSLLCFLFNRPECGTRKSLTRISHDISVKFMQSDSQLNWVLSFAIRELLVPEHLAAMLSFFLLRSLASFLPFFKDFEAGSVLSFSTLYYSFITFIFPLCCCFAWWARLFDETARIFLFLCTSMMLGAFQIAYYVAAEVNVSTITALKYLVIYLPWPCLTIGFVLMYLPITFSQPDGGNLAMALRLPFSPNHVPSDRHMGPLATATLQFVMYVLANLWSTSAAKKLAEQAVSTFEIGYLSVSPLDHSGYILLIVAFVMGLGIVSKSLTAAAMLSSTRKLEFRGCAAVTDGVHSKVRPTIDNFKSLFERLHKLVNEVITLETEGKLSKFGGIHHVLTKFPLEHAIQFISQFDHTLELSQQLYPRVPLEDYPSVVGLPKMRLVLQYLGQRSETTQAPTANSQNFFSRAEDRGRRLVADSKLLPVLSKVAGVLNGGDNATYESFDVLDVAVDFKPIKLGEQGPSIFKASAADPSEDAASASRPHADQKALKTVIHMSLGSDISRLIGRLTDRFQEKWSSLLTGSLSDFLDPVRLRVMVEIEAKSGKFFVGLPFLSSHLASGGVGVPTPADLEKHVTNFLKTVTDASSTLQKLSEHSETGALLTTFLRRLNDLSDLLGRLHASHHVGFVELLKLLSRFASLAFAVHEKIGSETVTRPQARAGGEEKKEENKEQGNRSAQLHDYQEETLLHHRYIRGLMVELFEDCVALFSTIFLQEINKISEESLHGILYGQEAISTFLLPFSILFWKVYFNEIVGQIEASEEAASRENHASRELRVFWANVHSRSALDIPFPKKPSKSPEQGWATVHNTADVKENDSTLFSEVVAFLGKGVHFAVQGTAGVIRAASQKALASVEARRRAAREAAAARTPAPPSETKTEEATPAEAAPSEAKTEDINLAEAKTEEPASVDAQAPATEARAGEATPAEAHAASTEAKTEEATSDEAQAPPTEAKAEDGKAQTPPTEAKIEEPTPAQAPPTEAKAEEAPSDEVQAAPTEAVKTEEATPPQAAPTEAKAEETTAAEAQAGPTVTEAEDTTADETQAAPTEAKAEDTTADETQANTTEAKAEETTVAEAQAAPTEAKAEEATLDEAQAPTTEATIEDSTSGDAQAAPTEAKAQEATLDEAQEPATEAKAEETTAAEARAASTEATAEETTPSEAQAAPTEAKTEETTLAQTQAPTTEATIEDSTSGDAQAAPTEAKAQEATLDEAQEPATEAKAEETTAAEARAASTEATAEETTPSEAQAAPTEAKTEETTLAQTQAPTTEAKTEDSTSGDAQAAPSEVKAEEATSDEAQAPATEAKAEEATSDEAQAPATEAKAEEATSDEAQAPATEATIEDSTSGDAHAPPTEAQAEEATSDEAQPATEAKAEETTLAQTQAAPTEAKTEDSTSGDAQAAPSEVKAEEATSDEAQAPATEATIEDSTSGDVHAPPTEAQAKAEEATSDEAQAPANEATAEETTPSEAQAAPTEAKAEETTAAETQAPTTEAKTEDSTSAEAQAAPAKAKAEEATLDEAQPATEAKAEETTLAQTQAPTTEATIEDSTSGDAQAAPSEAKAEEATSGEAQAPATEAKAEETTAAEIDQTPSDSKEAAIAHVDTAGTGDGSKVEEEPAPSDSPQNRATDAPDAESSSKNGFSDIVERVSRMLHICGTPEGRSLSRLLSKIGQKQSSLEADLLMIVTVLTNGGDAQRSTAEEEKPMTPLLFTAHQALEFASIRNLVANSKILQTLTSNFPEPYNAGQLQRTALLAKSRISLFDKLQEAFANIAQHYRQAATSTQSLSDALVVLKKATASFLELEKTGYGIDDVVRSGFDGLDRLDTSISAEEVRCIPATEAAAEEAFADAAKQENLLATTFAPVQRSNEPLFSLYIDAVVLLRVAASRCGLCIALSNALPPLLQACKDIAARGKSSSGPIPEDDEDVKLIVAVLEEIGSSTYSSQLGFPVAWSKGASQYLTACKEVVSGPKIPSILPKSFDRVLARYAPESGSKITLSELDSEPFVLDFYFPNRQEVLGVLGSVPSGAAAATTTTAASEESKEGEGKAVELEGEASTASADSEGAAARASSTENSTVVGGNAVEGPA